LGLGRLTGCVAGVALSPVGRLGTATGVPPAFSAAGVPLAVFLLLIDTNIVGLN